MKTVAIVQARMKSTRLPGKVMMNMLGKPMLYRVIERLRLCHNLDGIVVATPDKEIKDWCNREFISCVIGPENHVLLRYYKAATIHEAKAIIRVTADCPLVDPKIVDDMVQGYVYTGDLPLGMVPQYLTYSYLEDALYNPTPFQIEHVIKHEFMTTTTSNIRLTVDTQDDFDIVEKIFSKLYPINPAFSMKDCVEEYKKLL